MALEQKKTFRDKRPSPIITKWSWETEEEKQALIQKVATPLLEAVKRDDVASLERIIKEASLQIDEVILDGRSLLTIAAMDTKWATVTYLLRKNPNLFLPQNSPDQPNAFHLLAQALLHKREDKSTVSEIPNKEALKVLFSKRANDALFNIIEEGDLETLKQILVQFPEYLEAELGEDNDTPLTLAAYHGHEEMVQYLIGEGANVFAQTFNNETAWDYACENDHNGIIGILAKVENAVLARIVELIEKDDHEAVEEIITTSPGLRNCIFPNNQTPLIWAIKNQRWAAVACLLDEEADLFLPKNKPDQPNAFHLLAQALFDKPEGKSLISEMSTKEELQDQFLERAKTALLDMSVEGDLEALKQILAQFPEYLEAEIDEEENTPLTAAARHGHEDMVKFLLGKGANVFAQDEDGRTAQDCARKRRHDGVVEILAKAEQAALVRIMELVEKDDHEAVEQIITTSPGLRNRIFPNNQTPLIWAIKNQRWIAVAYLLDKDVDLFLPKQHADQPNAFHLLAQVLEGKSTVSKIPNKEALKVLFSEKANDALFNIIVEGDLETLKQILAQFPEYLEAELGGNNHTPLTLAAYYGHEDMVQYLSGEGANVFARNGAGETARESVLKKRNNGVIVEILVAKEKQMQCLIQDSIEKNEIKSLISTHPALVNVTFSDGQTPLAYAITKKCWESVIEILPKTRKFIFPEFDSAQKEVLSLLQESFCLSVVDGGPTQDERNSLQMYFPYAVLRALHNALEHGNLSQVKHFLTLRPDFLEVFVDGYNKPLAIASHNGCKEVVEYLLACGANVFARNTNNETAQQLATRAGHSVIAEKLLTNAQRIFGCFVHQIVRGNADEVYRYVMMQPELLDIKFSNGYSVLTWYIAQKNWAVILLFLRNNQKVISHVFMPSNFSEKTSPFALLTQTLFEKSDGKRQLPDTPEKLQLKKEFLQRVQEFLYHMIKAGYRDNVQQLFGYFPTFLNKIVTAQGDTPLILATKCHQAEIVEDLLKNGANIFARNYQGDTALQVAEKIKHKHIIETLTAKEKQMQALIESSIKKNEVNSLISTHPEIVDVTLPSGHTILTYAITIKCWKSVIEILQKTDKLFLPAPSSGQEDAFSLLNKCLFAAPADGSPEVDEAIFLQNEFCRAACGALFDAINNRSLSQVKQILTLFSGHLEILVDQYDNRPLGFSAKLGCKEIVEYLLRCGADISAKNINGETAQQLATKSGYDEIAALFTQVPFDYSADTRQLPDMKQASSLAETGGIYNRLKLLNNQHALNSNVEGAVMGEAPTEAHASASISPASSFFTEVARGPVQGSSNLRNDEGGKFLNNLEI